MQIETEAAFCSSAWKMMNFFLEAFIYLADVCFVGQWQPLPIGSFQRTPPPHSCYDC